MKQKISSFYSRLLSACLVLLGFTSCGMTCEYGVPSAKYNVQGKVVSAEGAKTPVKGIRVVAIEDANEADNPYLRGDTVYTNSEGKFVAEWGDFPHDNRYKIKFQDVDGEANSLFEDKEQIIEFKNSEYKDGDGHWYKGEAKKDMGRVELKPKKAEN